MSAKKRTIHQTANKTSIWSKDLKNYGLITVVVLSLIAFGIILYTVNTPQLSTDNRSNAMIPYEDLDRTGGANKSTRNRKDYIETRRPDSSLNPYNKNYPKNSIKRDLENANNNIMPGFVGATKN